MEIQKLDPKTGKLLVFGGVYSNLQALEALREKAAQLGIEPDHIICNGDAVGYCAQPEEVVQLIKEWGIYCIAGNVELQLAEGKEDCGCDFNEGSRCDIFSRQWYPYAQSVLSKASIEWAKNLPEFLQFEWEGQQVAVVHGSGQETAEYIFNSTPWEKKVESFNKFNADIIVAGHSGLPFYQQQNNKHWLNPGVIGMPANDGETHVWYATIEFKESNLKVQHHQLQYNHVEANKKMVANKLPDAYAKTLLSGIWDNCEILPAEETALQGKPIEL